MIYQVLLPLAVDFPFSYHAPMPLEVGQLVKVPFRGKEMVGVVWSQNQDRYTGSLKSIISILPWHFPVVMQQFVSWVADYNLAPLGNVLKMALPSKAVQDKKSRSPLSLPSFCSPQSLASLSCEQTAATQHITKYLDRFAPILLHGVTGSGKTEVYFHILNDVICSGKQVLVLLPEIALTSQWFSRFEQRFNVSPLIWHSHLSESTRRQTWQAIIKGDTQVIVGARSALFLPFPNLGLIIVDEEHDSSYKQEEQVLYHARDMAVKRAQLSNIPIILASATPSLETLLNAEAGRYHYLKLNSRFGVAQLPQLSLIDMRKQSRSWLSAPLCQALEQTLKRQEQAILFLNRRGYAPLTLCHECGHRLQCPDCQSWLVEHKSKSQLLCHYCQFHQPHPSICPECLAPDSLIACGPGVERIVEEVTKKFPTARIAVLTSDHIQNVHHLKTIVDQITHHDVDFIIGTQILAKGYHFPLITLVGVIDADLGLSGSDLRASEKTYQLLHQVAGRSGRDQRPGHVLLQTFNPDHPIFDALKNHDQEYFFKLEAAERQHHNMPPYGRLMTITISALKADLVTHAAQKLSQTAPREAGLDILGPAPAPLYKLRGRFRWRFLIKASKTLKIQPIIKQWLQSTQNLGNVRISVDIDPHTFT